MIARGHFVKSRRMRGERLNDVERDWCTLYVSGWTLDRISSATGYIKGKKRVGSYSPEWVRQRLQHWGVPMRKPGGRGSLGASPMVKIAELLRDVESLKRRVSDLSTAVAELQDNT